MKDGRRGREQEGWQATSRSKTALFASLQNMAIHLASSDHTASLHPALSGAHVPRWLSLHPLLAVHNFLLLQHLHAYKQEEMPSSFLCVCCSTPVGICILAQNEMHPTSLQHCANGARLQGIRFLHPRCVHNRTTSLSWFGQSAFLHHNSHQDGGEIDNHMRPCHRPRGFNIYIMRAVSTLKYTTKDSSLLLLILISSWVWLDHKWLCVLSPFSYDMVWVVVDIHRLFKLSMMLRINSML